MGMRTVVMFSNDRAHEWSEDPELGKKIFRGLNRVDGNGNEEVAEGVFIVQMTHADNETLAIVDGVRGFYTLTRSAWMGGDGSTRETKLKLLQQAASNLGFDLVER